MRRLIAAACFGVAAFSGVSTHTGVSAAAGGNSDAAHMCQQGGYLTVQGSDGTVFTNAGQCTSYAAHGGTLVPISTTPSCTVVNGTSGCITLGGVNFPDVADSTLGTVTLSGFFNFSPTASSCNRPCSGPASGGGTYTLSSGSTFNGGATSGTFSVTNMIFAEYAAGNLDSSCANAQQAIIDVAVTFTSTTGTWSGVLDVQEGPQSFQYANILDQHNTFLFQTALPAPGLSYSC